MERIDPKMAARVWDRVQAPSKPELDATILLPLIREEWLDARIGKHLGLNTDGTKETIACLKGIYRILTGTLPKISPPQWTPEKTPVLLRQSFDRRLQLLQQYGSLQTDLRFGPVFSRLTAVSQAQVCKILETLGKQ